MSSCKGKKYSGASSDEENSDSVTLIRANQIADSFTRATAKPDTTVRVDTAKILSNPDFAFVHNCIRSNCKQMEVIHFGIVNGFERKIKSSAMKMMPDYVQLNAQLQEYAVRNSVPLSTDTTLDLSYTNSMDGVTWDSTWIALVIRDQTAMQRDLQAAQKVIKDAQLQSIVQKHLAAVSKHIEVASDLKRHY